MAFLSPLFLAGAIAAIVPIALHLFRRHAEQRVRFAAVALLKGAAVEHAARRRPRELLLLALRVSALVLLALAFARPFFRAAAATSGGLTVVAIDTSLSMSAPATVRRARQLARDAVRSASAGDDVAVVTFADRAAVVVPPTPDRSLASAAIDAVTPGFGSTRYRAGLAAAGQLFAGRTGAIVVVTDLQASGWDAGDTAAVPESVRVDVKNVDAPLENLSVAGLRVDGERLMATIRNSGARARDARARLSIDGRPAGVAAAQLGAHDMAEVSFPLRAGGVAVVTVDDPEGIPGDNARYALLANTASAATLVVTTTDLDADAWYVHQALLASRPAGKAVDVTGVSAAQLGAWSGDRLSRFSTVILVSTRGLERRGRENLAAYVNAGGGLLIAAGPDVDGDVVADVLGPGAPLEMQRPAGDPEMVAPQHSLSLAPADLRHPIFRSFGADAASLGLVQFHGAARISGPSCQTLARFTSGDAAILDCTAGNGRGIVIASDLNNRWNDFAIRASFVPFLDQTLRYLSNSESRGTEYLIGEVPDGIPEVPGVANVDGSSGSRGSRVIVVNVDPRESEADRMPAADFQAWITRLKDAASTDVRADVAEQESRLHLWQYLVATAMVVLAIEGLVAGQLV